MTRQAAVRTLRDITGDGVIARALVLSMPTAAVLHTVGRLLLRVCRTAAVGMDNTDDFEITPSPVMSRRLFTPLGA